MTGFGPGELRVAQSLRDHGWRWMQLDELGVFTGLAWRTCRHHLDRFVEQGLVEKSDELRGEWWRWVAGSVSAFDDVLGPVAGPPERCRRGHRLTGENLHVWPDGELACRRCGQWAPGSDGKPKFVLPSASVESMGAMR